MNINLPGDQKQQLLDKFKALNSFKEKLTFWREELKEEYIKFLYYTSLLEKAINQEYLQYWESFADFRIIPKKQEYEEYNLTMVDEFKLIFNSIANKKGILSISEMLADYERRSKDKIMNRKEFIQKEIDRINNEVEINSNIEEENLLIHKNSGAFFKHAYEQYFYTRKPIDFSQRFYPDLENLLASHKGSVYAEYIEFLESELERVNKAPKKTKDFSINQQLLILDYWGIMYRIRNLDNTKQAEQLSLFLNKTYQNVRVSVSNLDKLKSSKINSEKENIRKDLQVVYEFFKELGLNREAKEVKEDLAKLDQ